MAGHNKWSKVKHKKAATDARKSKIFSKYAHLIALESKKAGGDTNAPGLKTVIDKAKSENMPLENIERAIRRGAGADGTSVEEVVYETYGPGGVAVIIDAVTDNRNRTAAEIKHLLSQHGIALAAPGSAIWAFTKTDEGYTPHTTVPLAQADREKLATLTDALEEHDDVTVVYTNAE